MLLVAETENGASRLDHSIAQERTLSQKKELEDQLMGLTVADMGTGPEGRGALVIDDDVVMRRLFENILRHIGCQVLTAQSGREGIDLAVRHLPQLIILDYVMPDMDGLAVLKELKSLAETGTIPVLMATGYLDAGATAQFLAAGAAACLAKPFEARQLEALVEKLLPRNAAPCDGTVV